MQPAVVSFGASAECPCPCPCPCLRNGCQFIRTDLRPLGARIAIFRACETALRKSLGAASCELRPATCGCSSDSHFRRRWRRRRRRRSSCWAAYRPSCLGTWRFVWENFQRWDEIVWTTGWWSRWGWCCSRRNADSRAWIVSSIPRPALGNRSTGQIRSTWAAATSCKGKKPAYLIRFTSTQ